MQVLNKRGAALFQVLIVSAILAGIAAMVLRSSLSRTLSARQMRHTISAQIAIEACMAEINNLWAAKTPEQYAEDLDVCRFYQSSETNITSYTCEVSGKEITATISPSGDSEAKCKIEYTINNGIDM